MERVLRKIVAAVFAGIVVGAEVSVLSAQTNGIDELDFSHNTSEEECAELLDASDPRTVSGVNPFKDKTVIQDTEGRKSEFLVDTDRFILLLNQVMEASIHAKENAEFFTKTWEELSEIGADGSVKVKEDGSVKLNEDAFKRLFSAGGYKYDCIIYAAESYYAQMTGERFRRAVNSVGLVAGRLKDMLTDEIENAESDQIKASFKNMKEEIERREVKVAELKDRLAKDLNRLRTSISRLEEWKRVVVYSVALEIVDEAIENLARMVTDVAEFNRLINEVADDASGLAEVSVS